MLRRRDFLQVGVEVLQVLKRRAFVFVAQPSFDCLEPFVPLVLGHRGQRRDPVEAEAVGEVRAAPCQALGGLEKALLLGHAERAQPLGRLEYLIVAV